MPETLDIVSPDNPARFLSDLGLCARARSLAFGTAMVLEALRSAAAPQLVLCASDISEPTKKKLCDKCRFYHVPLLQVDVTGVELAHAVGKSASLAAVAIRNEQLVHLLEKHWNIPPVC